MIEQGRKVTPKAVSWLKECTLCSYNNAWQYHLLGVMERSGPKNIKGAVYFCLFLLNVNVNTCRR